MRVPEREEEQGIFARMQLVIIDMNKKEAEIVLHYKSPIYNGRDDLSIGNPTFAGEYLVWQDYILMKHRIYIITRIRYLKEFL